MIYRRDESFRKGVLFKGRCYYHALTDKGKFSQVEMFFPTHTAPCTEHGEGEFCLAVFGAF